MRVATQNQVTTKVDRIKEALNSFSYTHKCFYYYRNNSINSSWSTNISLPADGKTYKFLLCYTFSANPYNSSSNNTKYGMIINLGLGSSTQRVIQGFNSACTYSFGASKNNISTGMFAKNFSGQGQSIPVSITLKFQGSQTLQEGEGLSGFQLAVMEIPDRMVYERL